MKIRREMPRPVQKRRREVDADDLSSALSTRGRMPPMTATNVNDARARRKLEQAPQAGNFQSNLV
jgi:hypothetical protein